MPRTGRNAPCPCGSGKKYKKCCLRDEEAALPPLPGGILGELLAKGEFHSLEEARGAVSQAQTVHNTTPKEDFLGLSPNQMHRFMYVPFESTEDLVRFNTCIDRDLLQTVPICRASSTLIGLVAELGPIKPTQNGNLPRKVLKPTYCHFAQLEEHRGEGLRSEDEFPVLHALRRLVMRAGWMRLYRGRFRLTKSGEDLAQNGMGGETFLKLLRHYCESFSWSFADRHQELPVIQQTFLFLLYVLHLRAAEVLPSKELARIYARAFPAVIREIAPQTYADERKLLHSILVLRFIRRFCLYFGLVRLVGDPGPFAESVDVATTGLFDAFFLWQERTNSPGD